MNKDTNFLEKHMENLNINHKCRLCEILKKRRNILNKYKLSIPMKCNNYFKD